MRTATTTTAITACTSELSHDSPAISEAANQVRPKTANERTGYQRRRPSDNRSNHSLRGTYARYSRSRDGLPRPCLRCGGLVRSGSYCATCQPTKPYSPQRGHGDCVGGGVVMATRPSALVAVGDLHKPMVGVEHDGNRLPDVRPRTPLQEALAPAIVGSQRVRLPRASFGDTPGSCVNLVSSQRPPAL